MREVEKDCRGRKRKKEKNEYQNPAFRYISLSKAASNPLFNPLRISILLFLRLLLFHSAARIFTCQAHFFREKFLSLSKIVVLTIH